MKRIFSIFIILIMLVTTTGSVVGEEIDNSDYTVKEYTYFDLPKPDGLIVYPHTTTRAWPGYSARNIRYTSQTTAVSPIRVYTLDGGTGADFEIAYSKETTVEGVLSIGGEDINASLGISTTSTVTISDTLHADCPSSRSYCNFRIYPKFQNFSFDEYFLEAKVGNGTGQFLIGYMTILQEYQ